MEFSFVVMTYPPIPICHHSQARLFLNVISQHTQQQHLQHARASTQLHRSTNVVIPSSTPLTSPAILPTSLQQCPGPPVPSRQPLHEPHRQPQKKSSLHKITGQALTSHSSVTSYPYQWIKARAQKSTGTVNTAPTILPSPRRKQSKLKKPLQSISLRGSTRADQLTKATHMTRRAPPAHTPIPAKN